MVEGILVITSIALSSVGITVAVVMYIYVRCFAMKKLNARIEAMKEEHIIAISQVNKERMGIEPKKEVVVQQLANQESTRSTVTDSTYFVSYFGMCFQKEPIKSFGETSNSHKAASHDNKKMMMIDEERGENKPVQSIEIPKHEQKTQRDEMARRENNMNTLTSSDIEQTSVESSLSDPHQHQDIFRNTPNFDTTERSKDHNNFKSHDIFHNNPNAASNEKYERYNNNDDDGDLDKFMNGNNENQTNENEDDDISFRSDDNMEYSDDGDMENSSDGKKEYIDEEKMKYSDDDDSFQTPEEYENEFTSLKLPSGTLQSKPQKVSPQEYDIDAIYLAAKQEQSEISPDNGRIQYSEDISPNKQMLELHSSTNEYSNENPINYTKTFQSENQSYFSSDEEKSSPSMDDDDYYNNTNFSSKDNDEFTSPRYLVHKIDSSLSIPDLADSSDSGSASGSRTSNNSGDWELSSSSEDRSEKEDTRRRITQRKESKNIVQEPVTKLDRGNSTAMSSKPIQTTIDICTFCSREYHREEGVKFSFNEKCNHLMCMTCCEEGKAAQFNGECPLCNLQISSAKKAQSKKKSKMTIPPRSGERKQEQVIMAI